MPKDNENWTEADNFTDYELANELLEAAKEDAKHGNLEDAEEWAIDEADTACIFDHKVVKRALKLNLIPDDAMNAIRDSYYSHYFAVAEKAAAKVLAERGDA